MNQSVTSPLTSRPANRSPFGEYDIHRYDEDLGPWAITEEAHRDDFMYGGSLHTQDTKLDERQTKLLLAYCKSLVRESRKRKGLMPMFATEAASAGKEKELGLRFPAYRVYSIDRLWKEAEALSFEDKAIRTLVNIAEEEIDMGDGVELPLKLRPYPGGYAHVSDPGEYVIDGLLYAAPGGEGLLILHHLIALGYIVETEEGSARSSVLKITPKGYAVVSQARSGSRDEIHRAFLVCRFSEAMDAIFDRFYRPAGLDPSVACPIERVKDVHHVDQITDKIVRMIREATIVVVDLTDSSFNVAFEAGYALALGKPIVWMKRYEDDDGDFHPPFDIQSQNIYRWSLTQPEAFEETLRMRMLAAIDKAKTFASVRV